MTRVAPAATVSEAPVEVIEFAAEELHLGATPPPYVDGHSCAPQPTLHSTPGRSRTVALRPPPRTPPPACAVTPCSAVRAAA